MRANLAARYLMRALLATAFGVVLSFPVPAGCVSDCREQYDSAVEDCRNMHNEPDDADDLRQCIEDAKSEYDDCVEECRS
jgi:hypothetical protein